MKKGKLKDPGKKEMLLVLPFLVIPFLTMAFWALGGGKGNASNADLSSSGLNLQLPNAQLKEDKGEDKLSYYQQAEKDSAKWKEGMENEPLYPSSSQDSMYVKPGSYNPYPLQTADYKDPNEQKVYQKLAELNHHLQNHGAYSNTDQKFNMHIAAGGNSFEDREVSRLEAMMKTVSSPTTGDPEVEQLNTMMDRILDIQHPERVKQKLEEQSVQDKEDLFFVRPSHDSYSISLLDTLKRSARANGFYSVDIKQDDARQSCVEAVIHESQNLVNGSIVKMRLLNNISIGNSVVLKGSFVFGSALLQGERLHIEISSIRKGNSIYPVKLQVYDLDGMEGIHIPGAIIRDAAKESADNSLQNIELGSIDPSLKGRATTAGISAAKSLLVKKAKLVSVTVKAGYKILLKGK